MRKFVKIFTYFLLGVTVLLAIIFYFLWRNSSAIIKNSGIYTKLQIYNNQPLLDSEKFIGQIIFPNTFNPRGPICPSIGSYFSKGTHTSSVSGLLARDLNFSSKPDHSLQQAFIRVFISCQLENNFKRTVLLKNYLAEVYLGSGEYGVQTAAKSIFNKPISTLTETESLALVSLIQYPSLRSNPDRWKAHQIRLQQRISINR